MLTGKRKKELGLSILASLLVPITCLISFVSESHALERLPKAMVHMTCSKSPTSKNYFTVSQFHVLYLHHQEAKSHSTTSNALSQIVY